MNEQALKQFDFHGASLRTVMIKGEPWFVAVDVCKILGIENARDAISRIKSLNVGSTDVQNSRGQLRKTKIVNESGVRRAGDPHQYDDQGSDDLGQEPGQTAAGQKRQEGRVHDHGRAEMKKH
jgi:BRO family, N-terminal domain